MTSITLRGGAAIAAAAFCLAMPVAADAADKTPDGLWAVTVVNTVSRMADDSFLPVLVGQKRGVFRKHGMQVEVTVGRTSQVASASLVSGRALLGFIQPAYVVSANSAGGNFRLLGSVYHQLDYNIVTSTDITSLKQLEGKIMAGPGPNNGNTIVFRATLEKAGVNSGTLTYATVGAQSAILAALKTGQAQAGLLSTVAAREAVATGLIDQGPVSKYLQNQTSVGIATTTDLLKKEPDLIRSFLAALKECNDWVIDNPAEALPILAEAMKGSLDDARPIFEADFPLLRKTLAINAEGLQDWINIALEYKLIEKRVSVEEVYTPDFLPK